MSLLKKYIHQLVKESILSVTSFSDPSNSPWAANDKSIINNQYSGPHLEITNPVACCCFVQRQDDKILCVSRRWNDKLFGLPGGIVDANETVEDCAKRELQEECGVVAIALKEIFCDIDIQGYETHTFLCDVEDINNVKSSKEGKSKWCSWEELLCGPFGEYNLKLKNALCQ